MNYTEKDKKDKRQRKEFKVLQQKALVKGTFTGKRTLGSVEENYKVFFDKDGKIVGGGNRRERRRAAKLGNVHISEIVKRTLEHRVGDSSERRIKQ